MVAFAPLPVRSRLNRNFPCSRTPDTKPTGGRPLLGWRRAVGTDTTSEIVREAIVSFVAFVGILPFAAGIGWLLAPHLIDDVRVTPETAASATRGSSTTCTGSATGSRRSCRRTPSARPRGLRYIVPLLLQDGSVRESTQCTGQPRTAR